MAKVVVSAPHAHCRGDEDVELHQCDIVSGSAARMISSRLRTMGHSVSLHIADINRMDVDLNRSEGRETLFRRKLDSAVEGAAFLLDVHSFPGRNSLWGEDAVLLKLSYNGDNREVVYSLAEKLVREDLSITVAYAEKENDIVASATSIGVPAVLVEISEESFKDNPERIVDGFAKAVAGIVGGSDLDEACLRIADSLSSRWFGRKTWI